MTFVIGEKVVYPNQGVGTIENISSRVFGAQFERFYLLRLLYSSMTVMVPFSNVTNIGLRKITKTNEVSRVLAFLATGDRFSSGLEVSVQGTRTRCKAEACCAWPRCSRAC